MTATTADDASIKITSHTSEQAFALFKFKGGIFLSTLAIYLSRFLHDRDGTLRWVALPFIDRWTWRDLLKRVLVEF